MTLKESERCHIHCFRVEIFRTNSDAHRTVRYVVVYCFVLVPPEPRAAGSVVIPYCTPTENTTYSFTSLLPVRSLRKQCDAIGRCFQGIPAAGKGPIRTLFVNHLFENHWMFLYSTLLL